MKVIILDFDDTMIVSRTDRASRLLEALGEFGHTADETRIQEAWGLPFRQMIAVLSPSIDPVFDTFIRYYAARLRSNPPQPCPGVLETIPRLYASARLFVHSSSHSLLIRTDLETLGLLSYVEFVCGSDWQSNPKPDARSLATIRQLVSMQGSCWNDCIYVGDSPSDALLARAAGLRFVEASYSTISNAGHEREDCICSMADLIPMIDSSEV